MAPDAPFLVATALGILRELQSKSRIEKLKDLAETSKMLANAADATDDPEIDARIDEIAKSVQALAMKIRGSIPPGATTLW